MNRRRTYGGRRAQPRGMKMRMWADGWRMGMKWRG